MVRHQLNLGIFQEEAMVAVLNTIRQSGQYFFQRDNYIEALRKYKKAQRYSKFFTEKNNSAPLLDNFNAINYCNIAACELKLEDYLSARAAAMEVSCQRNKVFQIYSANCHSMPSIKVKSRLKT